LRSGRGLGRGKVGEGWPGRGKRRTKANRGRGISLCSKKEERERNEKIRIGRWTYSLREEDLLPLLEAREVDVVVEDWTEEGEEGSREAGEGGEAWSGDEREDPREDLQIRSSREATVSSFLVSKRERE